MPYIYQLCYQAHANIKPIIKPTFYDFEHDSKTFDNNQDFMIGKILVANILEENQRVREIYLPKGCSWYDYYTGDVYSGGQVISINVDLETIPLFVQDGAIINTNKNKSAFNKFDQNIVYKAFPSLNNLETKHSIYLDDGETNGYLNQENGFIDFEITRKDNNLNVNWNYQGHDKFKVSNIEIINMNKDFNYNA